MFFDLVVRRWGHASRSNWVCIRCAQWLIYNRSLQNFVLRDEPLIEIALVERAVTAFWRRTWLQRCGIFHFRLRLLARIDGKIWNIFENDGSIAAIVQGQVGNVFQCFLLWRCAFQLTDILFGFDRYSLVALVTRRFIDSFPSAHGQVRIQFITYACD